MITEKDLQEAIAECQGQKDPNANTCIKLAAFLIIKDHMYPENSDNTYKTNYEYKYSSGNRIHYTNDTEFSKLIDGMDSDFVWPIMDELMSTIQVLNKRLYESVIQKIKN